MASVVVVVVVVVVVEEARVSGEVMAVVGGTVMTPRRVIVYV